LKPNKELEPTQPYQPNTEMGSTQPKNTGTGPTQPMLSQNQIHATQSLYFVIHKNYHIYS